VDAPSSQHTWLGGWIGHRTHGHERQWSRGPEAGSFGESPGSSRFSRYDGVGRSASSSPTWWWCTKCAARKLDEPKAELTTRPLDANASFSRRIEVSSRSVVRAAGPSAWRLRLVRASKGMGAARLWLKVASGEVGVPGRGCGPDPLPGPAAAPAQGSARLHIRLLPRRRRRSLGRVLNDRALTSSICMTPMPIPNRSDMSPNARPMCVRSGPSGRRDVACGPSLRPRKRTRMQVRSPAAGVVEFKLSIDYGIR
jgi:hypothetical protein